MRYIYSFILLLLLIGCKNTPDKPETPVDRAAIIRDSLQKYRTEQYQLTQGNAANLIREVFEDRQPGESYENQGTEFYSLDFLPKVYIENEFKPLWVTHFDSLEKAKGMIDFIADAEYHGFNPDDYHYQLIKSAWDNLEKDSSLVFDGNFVAGLDLLLTDAFLELASHLYYGKLDAASLGTDWEITRDKPAYPFDAHLQSMLSGGDVAEGFKRYYPPYPGYEAMVAEARSLKTQLPEDFTVKMNITESIKPGDSLEGMAAIKNKLAFLGFYEPDTLSNPYKYDEKTVAAVHRLQEQFGYNQDGAIGKNTLKALNMPVEQKISQLYANMERLRWMPVSLEPMYVMVNIADFTLNVYRGDSNLLFMKTIVGQDYRETPVFNSQISYLVMSPSWHVPPTIKKKDVIPAVIKDVNYLKKKKMLVYDSQGKVVDPETVNWKKDGMRYSVKQKPGAYNSLGKVKFMFPNKHNVYLHDTPSRSLFTRDERAFSSGCIRVELPYELAALLLADMPDWTPERIRKAMDSGIERTVVLKDKVGVYIYYLTAWGNSSGKISYRTDIYNRDKTIEKALNEKVRKQSAKGGAVV